MLKSSSEDRTERRVCETRRSASYRCVTAARWTGPLTTLRRLSDNISHLSHLERTATLVRFIKQPQDTTRAGPTSLRNKKQFPRPLHSGPLAHAPNFRLPERSPRDLSTTKPCL